MPGLPGNLQLVIPIKEIMLMLIISVSLALFGKFKLSIATCFVFLFHWAFKNHKLLLQLSSDNPHLASIISFTAKYSSYVISIILVTAALAIFFRKALK